MVINLSEVIASWDKDFYGWSIAPAGVSWIEEGYRIKVRDNCIIGERCKLGGLCTLGDWCTLGDHCTIGGGCTLWNGCTLGNECILGERCVLGNRCILGDECILGGRCILGDRCILGANATDPIDLGVVDGYRKCIANVDGVAYIGAGCRWFTLQDAIKHWEKREDRVLTRALMEYAISIAKHKGWVHN